MKKSFKLQAKNKHKDRVVESIKNEIRKYIKREQRKELPKDKDFWFFDCKFGKNDETPVEIQYSEITKSIDEAAASDAESLYMEIISRAEKRPEKEIIEVEDTVEEILEEVSQEDTSI